jgi:hypothetical protein
MAREVPKEVVEGPPIANPAGLPGSGPAVILPGKSGKPNFMVGPAAKDALQAVQARKKTKP